MSVMWLCYVTEVPLLALLNSVERLPMRNSLPPARWTCSRGALNITHFTNSETMLTFRNLRIDGLILTSRETVLNESYMPHYAESKLAKIVYHQVSARRSV